MSFVYIGNKFTSSMQRHIEKDRVCEKCGFSFKHSFYISAKGQELSLYGLDDEGARHRADSEAKKTLNKAERENNPLFPCPSCGWFQSDMVLTRKKHLFSGLLMIVLTVPAFCTVLAILASVIIYAGDGFQGIINHIYYLFILLIIYSVCALLVVAIWAARKFYNPNRHYGSLTRRSPNSGS